VLNEDGTLNEHGLEWAGMDRFAARKATAAHLEERGDLVKVETYASTVGTSERTGAVVEPRLSLQWWIRMPELAKPALDAVMGDEIQLIPEKFKNTYRHWMENVKDWCISRQLWWGHQIPAYFYGEGEEDFVVALSVEEALEKARQASGNNRLQASDLRQDEDCLDTWFSSWLWPISVFDGINKPNNPELDYYYPTQDLVTAPEILFFWVARMAMAGYEYTGKKPFEKVYLTGIVRDKLGRKMSKSLGNSPDPLALIEQYGADGVRMGMLMSSPAGNDLPFDEDLCLQGRNFSNKVWNALRLVKGWEAGDGEVDAASIWAMTWFEQVLSETLTQLEDDFMKYRLSDALMRLYKLIWDDFCSWYLEMVKPAYGEPIAAPVLAKTVDFFEALMKALHPFMPFITEEAWHVLREVDSDRFLNLQDWPKPSTADRNQLAAFAHVEELIVALRNVRKERNLSFKQPLDLRFKGEAPSGLAVVEKLVHAPGASSEVPDGALAILAGTREYFLVFSAVEAALSDEDRAQIEKDIAYYTGFIASIEKKLSNPGFVNNAPPAVIEIERKKVHDSQAKLAALQARLG
jgi:valyl-tRNA synthetase